VNDQMELGLSRREMRMRRGPELAAEMIGVLRAHTGWLKRKDMAAHGFSERECRLARQYAKGRILAGQNGYRLTEQATLEEIRVAADTLMSQSRVMAAEASELWAVLHRRQRPE